MTHPDDLVAEEGVDEGSAASSSEGDAGPDPDAVLGEPPHGAPATEQDAAGPEATGAGDVTGPGQQLSEGEG